MDGCMTDKIDKTTQDTAGRDTATGSIGDTAPHEDKTGDSLLKKRELIERVVARSGRRKGDARAVIEATLAVLGDTISQGRGVDLQPLGKLHINRSKAKPTHRITVCKLRQKTSSTPAKDPLADRAE
ncbi:HU family DNA-binding protein [Sedimentitalea sp. HM32M-2]|uniref:HU family DNA-binding protein n=1 Tax=Sedimentitalea sp. HM32M-2 TaxID=3351566 RepID=UPI0036293B80